MIPEPLSPFQGLAPLFGRHRAKPTQPKRPPQGHRFCAVHPERCLPTIRKAGVRCWLCEEKCEDFRVLDVLIAIGLGEMPQHHITLEKIHVALRMATDDVLHMAQQLGWTV